MIAGKTPRNPIAATRKPKVKDVYIDPFIQSLTNACPKDAMYEPLKLASTDVYPDPEPSQLAEDAEAPPLAVGVWHVHWNNPPNWFP